MKTKKQRKRRAGLNPLLKNIKSKLGHGQGGKLHNSAKKLGESLDREEELKK